jgi:hypothetical protein
MIFLSSDRSDQSVSDKLSLLLKEGERICRGVHCREEREAPAGGNGWTAESLGGVFDTAGQQMSSFQMNRRRRNISSSFPCEFRFFFFPLHAIQESKQHLSSLNFTSYLGENIFDSTSFYIEAHIRLFCAPVTPRNFLLIELPS